VLIKLPHNQNRPGKVKTLPIFFKPHIAPNGSPSHLAFAKVTNRLIPLNDNFALIPTKKILLHPDIIPNEKRTNKLKPYKYVAASTVTSNATTYATCSGK